MALQAVQTSWNGGELSRRMEGRVDTSIYAIGAAQLTNIVSTVEGPAVKRQGFYYVRAAMASASWLVPFVFNRTQAYVIELGEGAARFFTNGGQIENGGIPYEVPVPYAAAEAPSIQARQSFDRLYLAHGSHPLGALTRSDAVTFSYTQLALMNGPFKDRNADQDVVVVSNGTQGNIILTATCAPDPTKANIWKPGHVGGLFRIEAAQFGDITAWEPGYGKITMGFKVRSDGKVYEAVGLSGTKNRTGTVPPTHTIGDEWDGIANGLADVNDNESGGVLWRYLYDQFGIVQITGYTSASQVTATVLRRLADNLDGVPSYRWYQGAFSNAEGWPSAVTIWNSRLVLAKDFTIYGSIVGDYLNFADFTSSGQTAIDLSFTYTLSSSDPILWLLDEKNLVAGTASGIYPIGAVNTQTAPGPGNIGVQRPLAYGGSTAKPQQIGTFLQFIQRGGRKIREGQYDFARDGYDATNSTVWCRHLTKSGVIQLAYSQEPEEITWALRADGVILAHPFAPEQQVKGWSPIELGGEAAALSMVAIPSTDGGDDDLWLLVERDGKREIWLQGPWWDEDSDDIRDAFFVDGGLQMDFGNAPTAHLSGLQHIAGEDVWCLADGAMFTAIVADDGTLDLPSPKSKISIGLPYIARFVSMRPGQSQGKMQKIRNLFLRLIDTLALYAGARTTDRPEKLDALFHRSPQDPMGGALLVFNGDTDKINMPGGYDRTGQQVIESRGPFPWIMTLRLGEVEAA